MLESRLVLQHRSPEKKFNGWMLDKTFWWHCRVGQSRDISLEMEALEELWVTLKICPTSYEALAYFTALKWDLYSLWVGYIAETFDVISHRKMRDDKVVTIGNRVHFAPFLYNWPTEFRDNEASWTQVISLDSILWDIESWVPERQWKYTHDLQFLVTKFPNEIESIAQILKKPTSLPRYDGKAISLK